MEDIQESIEKLNEALKASEKTVMSPVLQVNDQTGIAEKYLTPEALEIINNGKKAKALLGFDGEQCVAKCAYFAVTVATKNVELGVEKLAEIANDLALAGLIHSILAPISSLELAASEVGKLPQSVVFFYPLVPIDQFDSIKELYEYFVEEGSTGKTLGNLSMDIPEGEFLAEARITHMMTVLLKEDSNARLFGVVNEYLKFLPKGTKFLGAKQLAVSDLSIPYELKFSNPLLQKVKKVDLEWVREVAMIDDKLEQFNLFTGIRYYGADGNRLYHYRQE